MVIRFFKFRSDVRDEVARDEILAKDGTVWNIINHAAANAETSTDHQDANHHDVQQIIYIAYEEDGIANKETSVHIVSQSENVSTLIHFIALRRVL
jgi:hypothetical protein